MQLDLEPHEINAIFTVLGDLPSKSNAWPLMMKIKAQAEAQAQTESEEVESTEEDESA